MPLAGPERRYWITATLVRRHWRKLTKGQRVIVVEAIIKLRKERSAFRARVEQLVNEIKGID